MPLPSINLPSLGEILRDNRGWPDEAVDTAEASQIVGFPSRTLSLAANPLHYPRSSPADANLTSAFEPNSEIVRPARAERRSLAYANWIINLASIGDGSQDYVRKQDFSQIYLARLRCFH